MSSKSSSSSKSFVFSFSTLMRTRRRGRAHPHTKKSDFERKESRAGQKRFTSFITERRFFVSNSLSFFLKGIDWKQNDHYLHVPSYRHDVSFALVHEFDRHAHAFAVETDVVVAHDDFKKERKKGRKRGGQLCPKTFSPSFFLSFFSSFCMV